MLLSQTTFWYEVQQRGAIGVWCGQHVKVTGQVGRAEDDRGRSMLSASTFDISQLEMNIVLA